MHARILPWDYSCIVVISFCRCDLATCHGGVRLRRLCRKRPRVDKRRIYARLRGVHDLCMQERIGCYCPLAKKTEHAKVATGKTFTILTANANKPAAYLILKVTRARLVF